MLRLTRLLWLRFFRCSNFFRFRDWLFTMHMHLSYVRSRCVFYTSDLRRFQRLSRFNRFLILRILSPNVLALDRVRRCIHCNLFGSRFNALNLSPFERGEVIVHGDADLLDRLWADSRQLFELFRRHVSKRFHGCDSSPNELLYDLFAEFRDLLERSSRAGSKRLHLLFNFLPLLFFALNVDLPAKQLRR